ncbi:MAG: mannose-6-phosphate isomerase, class I [Oligoflexia bacterium]|nr:mannose-6-phosphate isomerase, class I [Oligoflexia bacterium]
MTQLKPVRLRPALMNYDWGKRGSSSLAAKLAGIKTEDPVAELWLGTHAKGPAIAGSETLAEWLARSPEQILGSAVLRNYGSTLPFLFKVLSIAEPLSIQLHPNRKLAAELHLRDPKHYPDGNHKPEIAIALTEMPLLYGLRSFHDSAELLSRLQALQGLVGVILQFGPATAQHRALVEKIFGAAATELKPILDAVAAELRSWETGKLRKEDLLMMQLHALYPEGDPGVLAPYLLNFITLKPGQAIFTEAQVPHAYLGGDLIECMANSDNVVRAGLTPKFKDIPTLLQMLDFSKAGAPPRLIDAERPIRGVARFSVAECREFLVEQLTGPGDFAPCGSGSIEILISVDGVGELAAGGEVFSIKSGDALAVPALCAYQIRLSGGALFRAAVPTAA